MSRPALRRAMPMEPLCTTAATRPRLTSSGMVVPQGGGAAREVDEAEAVRPAHGEVVRPRDGHELRLGAHALGSRLAEAAREDSRAAHAPGRHQDRKSVV